jgi:hypothetical protein
MYGGGPDKDMSPESDIWFAQLVNLKGSPKGDERDELIIAPSDKKDRKLLVYVNNGVGEFKDKFQIDPKMSCSNARESITSMLFLRILTGDNRYKMGRCQW